MYYNIIMNKNNVFLLEFFYQLYNLKLFAAFIYFINIFAYTFMFINRCKYYFFIGFQAA